MAPWNPNKWSSLEKQLKLETWTLFWSVSGIFKLLGVNKLSTQWPVSVLGKIPNHSLESTSNFVLQDYFTLHFKSQFDLIPLIILVLVSEKIRDIWWLQVTHQQSYKKDPGKGRSKKFILKHNVQHVLIWLMSHLEYRNVTCLGSIFIVFFWIYFFAPFLHTTFQRYAPLIIRHLDNTPP